MTEKYTKSIENIKEFIASMPRKELYELAHRTTRKYLGNRFDSCSIINAKSGNCSENCKWCSQSVFSRCNIEKYPLVSADRAVKEGLYNSSFGIKRFSLVTSGKRVSKKEIDEICKIVKALNDTGKIIPCVSLGLIDEEDMFKLAEAGATRYHCNMESSPSYFGELCTTHTQEEKIKTLKAAEKAGLSLCSGGIIGMGETLDDRIELALLLRDLNVKSIPINFLNPIKGTPLQDAKPLTEDEILTTIAIFRLINPTAFLRFAGGRALISKEIQEKALYIGINSAIMGDMLTTLGNSARNDIAMFKAAGYKWEADSKEAGSKSPDDNTTGAGIEGAAEITTLKGQDATNNAELHIWHPYASSLSTQSLYFVESAKGAIITINHNGKKRRLIDGMSSWWAVAHGYNNKNINNAITSQLKEMSHVMFGGFTHAPAQKLAQLILEKLPKNSSQNLSEIFFADSGSVSVEVAMKMAIQYQASRGLTQKSKFATARSGYHGDTWNAMSVCDPVTGMHSLFGPALPVNYFLPAPPQQAELSLTVKASGNMDKAIKEQTQQEDKWLKEAEKLFAKEHGKIAAFIIEPVVQGAGGMRFYSPELLVKLHTLCRKWDILLIFDEIATGFGRTGELFATYATAKYTKNNEPVLPDIMCIGKALTGGYMTLSATICSAEIAHSISLNNPYAFMHGPTFMANPLACAASYAAINELEKDFHRVKEIEAILKEELGKVADTIAENSKNGKTQKSSRNSIKDIRVKGAIGVLEMESPVNLSEIQPLLVEEGIWLRPFGRLVYIMPPFVITDNQLRTLCRKTLKVVNKICKYV
ncbi:MAG: adenosylmethionine--8-amino-7-oxononanoate transaminase [Bacteroidales bacterium]|nr:adenosylmethionine--8-amino-7-oxononanoate transaminase [Bacteroidales bacterium]